MGNDCFRADGGVDSLLTNAELAVRSISSILWDSDLTEADVMCVEEALALLLHGDVSERPSAFFYSSHCCVIVVY